MAVVFDETTSLHCPNIKDIYASIRRLEIATTVQRVSSARRNFEIMHRSNIYHYKICELQVIVISLLLT